MKVSTIYLTPLSRSAGDISLCNSKENSESVLKRWKCNKKWKRTDYR